jgi:hypothetical protein
VVKKFGFVVWIAIIILIVLRVPSLFESFWYGDEGIYAAVADEMSQGKLLYSQIWDHKPPLLFWVFLPAALVGWGKGFVLLRMFNILLGVLSLVFVNQILKRKVSDWPRLISLVFLSFLLGSTILEGNILNAEVIFMAFNLGAILLFLLKKNFYLAGALAFLSLITKVPGFVELAMVFVAFGFIYLKEKGFKFVFQSVAKMAVGFLIPTIAMLVYFFAKGTIPDFVYANATFNQIYSLHQNNYFEIVGLQLPNTYLQLFSFVSIFILGTSLYWKKKISGFAYFSLTLLAAEIFASLLSAKNYGHYFLQILPGLTLLLAIFIQNFKNIFKVKNILLILTIIVFLIPSFLVFQKGGKVAVHANLTEYYESFFEGYILNRQPAKEKFWWGRQEEVVNISKYLDENYGDKLAYIYTSKPWVIALTDLNLTNKYTVWFHLEYRDVHRDEDMENMKKAEIFILDRDNQLLEAVADLVNNKFTKIDEFNSFEIYLKK